MGSDPNVPFYMVFIVFGRQRNPLTARVFSETIEPLEVEDASVY